MYQIEYQPKKSFKALISNKLDVALLFKSPLYGLEDIATLSMGLGVSGVASK